MAMVLRSIDCNRLRAGLVVQAQAWPWSSRRLWATPPLVPWLHPGPVPRPPDWTDSVNAPWHAKDLQRLRRSVRRGTPFGRPSWVEATAQQLGLEATLRPPGRPPKTGEPHDPTSSSPTLFS